MERLIKDANEYGATIGEVSDLSIESFADIVKAIDLIQRKQGIAGTTAKEAMHTIEGAARATQAAWKNVITAIAGGGDLQKAFDGLIQSLFGDGSEGSGLLANIIPRIQKTMDGIGQFVAKASPYIEKYLPSLFEAILPPLLDSAANLMVSLAKSLPKLIGVILDAIPRIMQTIADAVKKQSPVIGGALEVIAKAVKGLFGFIADNGDLIMSVLAGVLAGFAAFKTISFITSLLPAITSGIALLVTSIINAGGIIEGVMQAIGVAMITGPQAIIVAIVAAVAAIGALIYHLATEEEAVKSLNEAQKNHEETIKNLASAQSSYIDSVKGMQEVQNQLAKAQEETGLSGEELYDQFMQNKDAYMQMSPEQQRVLDLYIQMQEKQQSLKDSTEELAKAQSEEMVASLQEQASAVKEGTGTWDEYKQNVINAFEQQKISQDEAKQLLGEAMSEMSSDSQVAFMQDIPNNIKDGLNPSNYETDWQSFKNNWDGFWNLLTGKSDASFSDVISQSKMSVNGVQFSWSDVGNWFSGKWNEISGAFSGAADWFGFVFGVAKDRVSNAWDNIGSWFSGIWDDIKSAFHLDDLFDWGKDMIDNFINGIKSAWDTLKSTVEGIGQFIKDILGHTTPKEGPLKDDDVWTKHMMDNFIGGIDSSKGKLKKSITDVADMMAQPMTTEVNGVFSAKGNAFDENNKGGNVYNISFNQPVNSPVQMARKIREEAQYGLLGG